MVEVLAETTPHVNPVLQVKDIAVYAPLDLLVRIVKKVNNRLCHSFVFNLLTHVTRHRLRTVFQ